MKPEKKEQIFEALQGITYLEWKNICSAVERSFEAEITTTKNRVVIATSEKLKEFSDLL